KYRGMRTGALNLQRSMVFARQSSAPSPRLVPPRRGPPLLRETIELRACCDFMESNPRATTWLTALFFAEKHVALLARMANTLPMTLRACVMLVAILFLAGCETIPQGIHQAKVEMAQRYAAEPPGDYYIGRRYYKPDFKF